MSLTEAEKIRTSQELRANLQLSGVTPDQLCVDLGFSARQLEDTLHVRGGSRPRDVWLLRDHLEDLVRDAGGVAAPYSVLTEQARQAAAGWFPLDGRSRPRDRG